MPGLWRGCLNEIPAVVAPLVAIVRQDDRVITQTFSLLRLDGFLQISEQVGQRGVGVG